MSAIPNAEAPARGRN